MGSPASASTSADSICASAAASMPARLFGEPRALCVYSFGDRGTPDKRGVVLGLARGGACRGLGFRVGVGRRGARVAYRRERAEGTAG